jgi:hypothetical protein
MQKKRRLKNRAQALCSNQIKNPILARLPQKKGVIVMDLSPYKATHLSSFNTYKPMQQTFLKNIDKIYKS